MSQPPFGLQSQLPSAMAADEWRAFIQDQVVRLEIILHRVTATVQALQRQSSPALQERLALVAEGAQQQLAAVAQRAAPLERERARLQTMATLVVPLPPEVRQRLGGVEQVLRVWQDNLTTASQVLATIIHLHGGQRPEAPAESDSPPQRKATPPTRRQPQRRKRRRDRLSDPET